ncbi:MAG: CRTAC1 family protein [Bryobacterales bacterium]|nr:CRTAC1 family protein [Bryobacterales bacterium]
MVLRHHPTPEKHQIETMPGGVAVLDFDNDGRPDVFFANGAPQPSLKKSAADANRLYRNLGGGRFADVTARAGVQGEGYSMGVAAADFDNDGWSDLFVAGVERNLLYRNRGDGTFEDVTRAGGIPHTGWAVAGGWFDYDRDGRLDLLIVNYVEWNPAREPFCGDALRRYRTYCHPQFYAPLANILLHNEGGGRFRDVSSESGIGTALGKGMSAAFADYDGDGWPDIYVTNDTTPDFLFRNLGNGRFAEVGAEAGVALNDAGLAISSMGVDFRDVNRDGRPDAYVTALANEMFPLFLNRGGELLEDITYRARLAAATLPYSGWGTGLFDFDNDGHKDIFVANGDVNDNTEMFSSRRSRQPCLLLRQTGAGPVFAAAEALTAPALHRGAAFADFNGDGVLDAVVTRLREPPLLLTGAVRGAAHWLGVRLRGMQSNRDGLGAVIAADGQTNHATTAVGYASASETVVRFGLGAATRVEKLEVRWPSGAVQILRGVTAGQVLEVTEPARIR